MNRTHAAKKANGGTQMQTAGSSEVRLLAELLVQEMRSMLQADPQGELARTVDVALPLRQPEPVNMCASKEAPSIEQLVRTVHDGAMEAHEMLSLLERVLEPVLTPAPPASSLATNEGGSESPLWNEVNGLGQTVGGLRRRVGALIGRVQLERR